MFKLLKNISLGGGLIAGILIAAFFFSKVIIPPKNKKIDSLQSDKEQLVSVLYKMKSDSISNAIARLQDSTIMANQIAELQVLIKQMKNQKSKVVEENSNLEKLLTHCESGLPCKAYIRTKNKFIGKDVWEWVIVPNCELDSLNTK